MMKHFIVFNQSIALDKSLFRRIGFGIWVLSVALLNTCTDIPPKPTVEVSSVLLKEVISRKWKGVITIPSSRIEFIDSGVRRTNCFDFNKDNKYVSGTNTTTYEWKSDVYSNNNDPQQAWFLAAPNKTNEMEKSDVYSNNNDPQQAWFLAATNKTNEMELSAVTVGTDAFFFFILRYNVKDDHLSNQYIAIDDGMRYSVQQVLQTIADKAGGKVSEPSFKGKAIYMPVYLRNININKEGKSTLELNFAINFEAKPVDQDPDWDSIYKYFKDFISSGYPLIKDFWVSYEEVDDIEDGAGGCPDF